MRDTTQVPSQRAVRKAVVWIMGFALGCGAGIRHQGPQPTGAATIVLDEATLDQFPDRSILDLITVRLPQVPAVRAAGSCPVLLLRGQGRLTGMSNPDVYVDHVHTLDTCPLTMLLSSDVRRVEIYMLGVTARPAYGTGAHGLILIFTRGSPLQ